jgi:RNA polymerase sigma-70 factor, ECF subfamily
MLDPREDDDLIARAVDGDRAAFGVIVDRHGRAVFRIARAFGASEAEAEDVLQETFLSALRAAATYRPGVSSLRTWLFAIARNAGRHAKRRAREVPSDVMDETVLLHLGLAAGWGHEAPDDALERADGVERLARAVASLPEGEREVLVLRDVEGVSGENTAELLGLSAPAMKSRLHRARLRMMAALRAEEGGVVANERDVGGLTCGAVLARLGDYVDGELEGSETAKVEAHLRGCTVCERFGGRYARTVHAARERLGADLAIDDATFARVRASLDV